MSLPQELNLDDNEKLNKFFGCGHSSELAKMSIMEVMNFLDSIDCQVSSRPKVDELSSASTPAVLLFLFSTLLDFTLYPYPPHMVVMCSMSFLTATRTLTSDIGFE